MHPIDWSAMVLHPLARVSSADLNGWAGLGGAGLGSQLLLEALGSHCGSQLVLEALVVKSVAK
jgi:hypothetical protein